MSTQFPDVEAMVRSYLLPILGGGSLPPVGTIEVRTRVPDPIPDLFLQLMRTGGPAQNRVVENAQITFTAWGKNSETDALNLARQARQFVFDSATSSGMRLVRFVQEFAGIYADDDPVTNIPRYTWTQALRVRAPRS